MSEKSPDPKKSADADLRTRAILEAGKACFLQFGYDKTTIEDVAQSAGISRPLVYRVFPNKLAILSAIYDDLFADRYLRADAMVAAPGPMHTKLSMLFDILLIEPWLEMMGSPQAATLMAACAALSPDQEARHQARQGALFAQVMGSAIAAQVVQLSAEGLQSDIPSAEVLKSRLDVLIAAFAPISLTSTDKP